MKHNEDEDEEQDTEENDILLDECIEQLGFGRFQIKLFSIVNLMEISNGMTIMILGFISPSVQCEFGLTNTATALLTTAFFVGMFFGSFVWGIIGDRYGRKKGVCLLHL